MTRILLKNGNCFTDNGFVKTDLVLTDGVVHFCSPADENDFDFVFDCTDKYIFPGFADVHVHFREPGFSYKETIKSGSNAAASNGYAYVCTMPNLKPCPSNLENLNVQLDIIKTDAAINVIPFGSVTVDEKGKELSELDKMSEFVCGFSDDGVGIVDDELMRQALEFSKKKNKIISAHCEYLSLVNGGKINDCEFARRNSIPTISSESEWRMIERDIALLRQTGGKYHVCHISTEKSVELIRRAKKDGLDISCETAPHYLCLDDTALENSGKFKMNPPLRGPNDREALIEGILDGTIDMIATDHAPHSFEEKNRSIADSLNGIVGLECAFQILYTNLCKKNIISLEKLIELMSVNPCRRFNFENGISEGKTANLNVFDLESEYKIDSYKFKSMGKSTPFDGADVFGKCLLNIVNGKIVYLDHNS